LVVENTAPAKDREASFDLNLYDPVTELYFLVRIEAGDRSMPLDPTIIEKAPGPPGGE